MGRDQHERGNLYHLTAEEERESIDDPKNSDFHNGSTCRRILSRKFPKTFLNRVMLSAHTCGYYVAV